MEDSLELWIVTSLSILTSCGVGIILQKVLNVALLKILSGHCQRETVRKIHEIMDTTISTYMLVVGTYEKCILLGKGLVFEYYLTTLLLIILYHYALTSSPNPLPVVMKQWKDYIRDEDLHKNGDVESNLVPVERNPNADGVRRRLGETPIIPTLQLNGGRRHKPHSRAWDCLKRSAPSFLGLFFGLHATIMWLHFAWDGYLTSHHLTKTGLLRDCIIVLQTGPIQGFVIEASITFLFQYTARKLNNLHIGTEAQSYFISSCIQSAVVTTSVYTFINVTGSFANPLLAYALERECLYDVTSVVNHVIVYWFGALAGAVSFYAIPQEKHLKYFAAFFSAFVLMYFFTPGVLERNYIFF